MKTADHYVLIAAGIGITPMLAMADRLQRLGKPYVLHYAGRSRAQMALLPRALHADHGPALTLYVKDEGGRTALAHRGGGRAGQPPGVRLRPQPPDLANSEALGAQWPEQVLHYEHFSGEGSGLQPDKEHAFVAGAERLWPGSDGAP